MTIVLIFVNEQLLDRTTLDVACRATIRLSDAAKIRKHPPTDLTRRVAVCPVPTSVAPIAFHQLADRTSTGVDASTPNLAAAQTTRPPLEDPTTKAAVANTRPTDVAPTDSLRLQDPTTVAANATPTNLAAVRTASPSPKDPTVKVIFTR